jgi:hypothetical protein
MPKVKSKKVQFDNYLNATYVLTKYVNNTFELVTLVKRNNCFVLRSRTRGVCQ